MSRLRGRSQNRESQESCPDDPGAASQSNHFGAAKARPRLIALLLAFATLLVYLPVARNGFVNYDDPDYVTENPAVQNGLTWPAVQWAFTTQHASNWHPLTWLSHMIDCQLFGANAGAHHVVNVLFHALNAVLLFGLLLQLTGALWPAAFVAALFAWHPLHVESVAWISERKDVLSTCFGLLALRAYVSYASPKTGSATLFYGLSLLCFALSLMAKPMLVTLPFVMLLLDYWPIQRFNHSTIPRLVLEKWPFFLLTAVSCVITFVVQRNGEAMATLEKIPVAFRLENALTAYLQYLLKTVWPVDLAVVYPLSLNIPRFTVMTSVAVLVALSVAAALARKRCPYLPVGWLWFLGMLVPVIGLVQVGLAALADRYTYLPLVGIFIAVAFGVRDLINRFRLPKSAVAVTAGIVLAACLGLTEKQLHYWRNSESLFRHALRVTQDNGMAHLNLGTVFQGEGRLNEALAEYRAAEKLLPGNFHVHSNLGSVLDDLGRPEEALVEYRLALQLKSNLPAPHDGLGIVLAELGRYDEAMNEFSEAARVDPAYPWPYFQMGKALLQQGRDAEAIGKFREALRIDPDNFQILAYLAQVLAANEKPEVRDGPAARAYADRANVLSGGTQPFVLDALGMACAETGDFTNALAVTQNALDLATAAGTKNLEPLHQRLELYRNHQPWRESFWSTNTPPKEGPGK